MEGYLEWKLWSSVSIYKCAFYAIIGILALNRGYRALTWKLYYQLSSYTVIY